MRIYDGKFELKDWIEVSGESEHTSIVDFSFDKRNHVFCALNDGSAKFCNMKVQSNFKLLNECDSRKLKNYHKV